MTNIQTFPLPPENKPPPNCKEPRLLTTLEPKTKYVLHYSNLKLYLKLGCRKKQFNPAPQLENQSQCRRKTTQLVSRHETTQLNRRKTTQLGNRNETTQQEKTTQPAAGNETTQLGRHETTQLISRKRNNSTQQEKTTQLVSRNETTQLCTAVDRLQPHNRLQPPTTAYNRLQPPTTTYNRTACNRLATACNRLHRLQNHLHRLQPPAPQKQNRLFSTYLYIYFKFFFL
ncbi:hypothetical protein TNCV_3743641 [Trichonephila clavipes]|nr:hypothetical protein TNCV_3743641 [Trichonephila clavipes]